jgi:hypothetical protein
VTLSNCCHHLGVLETLGWVRRVHSRPVRGAIEHFYTGVVGIRWSLQAGTVILRLRALDDQGWADKPPQQVSLPVPVDALVLAT